MQDQLPTPPSQNAASEPAATPAAPPAPPPTTPAAPPVEPMVDAPVPLAPVTRKPRSSRLLNYALARWGLRMGVRYLARAAAERASEK